MSIQNTAGTWPTSGRPTRLLALDQLDTPGLIGELEAVRAMAADSSSRYPAAQLAAWASTLEQALLHRAGVAGISDATLNRALTDTYAHMRLAAGENRPRDYSRLKEQARMIRTELDRRVTQVTQDSAQDIRRWLPAPAVTAAAIAALDASPGAEVAVVGLFTPYKERHWWKPGQEVVTVPGLWLATEGIPVPGVMGYGEARDEAAKAAARFRDEQGECGTVAYAVIGRDGHVAVFEDIL